MKRTTITAVVLGLAAAGTFSAGTASGAGIDARVTSGELHPFASAAGSELDITGRAHMVRTGAGTTIVSVQLRGLEPGATYAVHVHAAPCSTGEADGHYKHDPTGPTTPPNEIWPGPVTANAAGNASGRAVADFTARPTAVSVVVHRSGPLPNKIACADLG